MVERRANGGEIRASQDGKDRTITGYAAIFGSHSEPIGGLARGGFKEKISPRAFDACLSSNPDIRCLANHSVDQVLGRTKSGTLKLATNNVGLRYTCSLPDTAQGNSIWESVRRGDITGSSFGFEAEDDEWDDKGTRTLRQVKLFDVGPVTFPAYSASTVSIRSASGTMETVKLTWYRTGKLRLPLVGEREMRQRVKQLRQELGGGDAENDDAECSCLCQSCQDDDCSGCDCEAGCDGLSCGGNCNCLTTREVAGRMRRPQGKTLYAPDAGPFFREQLQRQKELEQKIFDARQLMKLARR